jgi:membrane-associated phospholipid phosphatase
MRRRLRSIETRLLPRGWRDLRLQIALFVGGYVLYEVVRATFANGGYKPFGDATKIINLERTLHIFVEPNIQAWALNMRWLMDAADWTYLNGHFFVTLAVLVFIYLRRNDSFYFVRNMFLISMAIALVGYALYPTAPPRLMPEWGFTDAISQFMGVSHLDQGPTSALINSYAAVPSMHVCFAIMAGWSMARLSRHRIPKLLWYSYPLFITFVVVATGNHYLTDVFLGALTAGLSALLAGRLLARARPGQWAFGQAPA